MKDPAWAWKVLQHLLRDLRKPSWIVAHFAKKDRHISLEYVRHCRQKREKYGDPSLCKPSSHLQALRLCRSY